MSDIMKTTGVIRQQANSDDVHIEIVNLSEFEKKTVKVEVFSWGTIDPTNPNLLMPQELNVTPTNQETIPPNRNAFFNADISVTDHFEVRITFCDGIENVVANVFERDEFGNILKYILFKDLVHIDKC